MNDSVLLIVAFIVMVEEPWFIVEVLQAHTTNREATASQKSFAGTKQQKK
jgi:hypothetical protein